MLVDVVLQNSKLCGLGPNWVKGFQSMANLVMFGWVNGSELVGMHFALANQLGPIVVWCSSHPDQMFAINFNHFAHQWTFWLLGFGWG